MAHDRPLHELTATEIVAAIGAGRTTCEAVACACLERIAAREHAVQAWQHLDPDAAIAAARAFDRDRRQGPLAGVPFGVKDIIDTCDMPTAWGTAIYRDRRPRRDAACVALTRKAGGLLLGKTVTTEFANLHPGKTRNPHDPARTPAGSSSGSAAAVADFMVPIALGTQTTGSTIRPASFCGVFGYRPTYGQHRMHGVMEASGSLDTLGLLARSIEDIALYRDRVARGAAGADCRPAAPAAHRALPDPRLGGGRTSDPWVGRGRSARARPRGCQGRRRDVARLVRTAQRRSPLDFELRVRAYLHLGGRAPLAGHQRDATPGAARRWSRLQLRPLRCGQGIRRPVPAATRSDVGGP